MRLGKFEVQGSATSRPALSKNHSVPEGQDHLYVVKWAQMALKAPRPLKKK